MKDTVKRLKKQEYDKGLVPKIYKEPLKLNNKKMNNPIKNEPNI